MGQLSREARARLRGLSKDNAERVGLHLVMTGRLLDVDPERAYEHAQAAARRGGRIDVVREAAGIAAYRTGRFAEALRELRTVRRLNGSSEHLPLMADAERGLGRPERALALAASEEARTLDAAGRTELAIVVSGARSDLGEHDAALVVLDRIPAAERQGDLGIRVLQARAAALEGAGRGDEAAALLAGVDPDVLDRAAGVPHLDEDVVVYDVYEDTVDDEDADALADEAEGGERGDGAAVEDPAADRAAASPADVPAEQVTESETGAATESAAAPSTAPPADGDTVAGSVADDGATA
jgi:tetratricopeptide (TPR) repeat protein